MSQCADSCGTPVSYEGGLCARCASVRLLRERDSVAHSTPLVFLILWGAMVIFIAGILTWRVFYPGPH